MSKCFAALGAWLLLGALPALAADEVSALLRQADAYRRPAGAVRVDALVEQYRQGKLDKDRSYTIYVKPGRRSLVVMRHPAEVGQKVLMLTDQFWLLMPDSQRPLRITANQKLLGEASTGDIADMTWSEDYEGKVVGEEPCPRPEGELPGEFAGWKGGPEGRRCLRVDLAAARAGVTYARVELFVDKANRLPIKADLFVDSGKQAKEAWYLPKTDKGETRIMAMVLIDHLQSNRQTVIHYQSILPKEAPDEFFNPAALARNPLNGW